VVDLIEVPEHLLSQLGDAEIYLVKPAVHFREPASQEFDELLILCRGHAPCLSQVPAPFKWVQLWTAGLAVIRGRSGAAPSLQEGEHVGLEGEVGLVPAATIDG
jgi:hypothetical protein